MRIARNHTKIGSISGLYCTWYIQCTTMPAFILSHQEIVGVEDILFNTCAENKFVYRLSLVEAAPFQHI